MSVARIHLKRRSFEPTKAWRERPELFTTDLLDHHSADLLVLFTGQVFKDVALWLKIKNFYDYLDVNNCIFKNWLLVVVCHRDPVLDLLCSNFLLFLSIIVNFTAVFLG